METKFVKKYLDSQKIKVVETYDFDNRKVKYSEKIKGWKIDKFKGDEEIVRAFILTKLVNELGYKPENIETSTATAINYSALGLIQTYSAC